MVYIFVEDELSEAVVNKLLDYTKQHCKKDYSERKQYNKKGYGNIKREMKKYNGIAATYPVIVLVDLDSTECAPKRVNEFIDFAKNENLVFRVAVREVEAWLFADRKNFASFLGVGMNKISTQPEDILYPKELLFRLARKSKKNAIKEDIPPELESGARIGKNYNGRLKEFVWIHWDIDKARLQSKSLDKAIKAFCNITLFPPASAQQTVRE